MHKLIITADVGIIWSKLYGLVKQKSKQIYQKLLNTNYTTLKD